MHAWYLIAYAVVSMAAVVYVIVDSLDPNSENLISKPPKQTG